MARYEKWLKKNNIETKLIIVFTIFEVQCSILKLEHERFVTNRVDSCSSEGVFSYFT